MYTIAEITKIVNGSLEGNSETTIEFLCIDSRKIQHPNASIFIALKTAKSNGHHFIDKAISQGISALIVSDNDQYDIPTIKVNDTLIALQKLAQHHRSLFKIPVVGITGSNGKTIVKEWISFLLQDDFSICKNPKSYNSQVGVPLSVWSINTKHNLGVFEAGISKPNEMDKLANIIRPTIGVFTHFGDAHAAGFTSEMEKLKEKIKLFYSCETVVCSDINPVVINEIKNTSASLFTWGSSVACNLHVFKNTDQTYTLTYKGDSYSTELPFSDKASLENAFNSIATCLVLGVSLSSLLAKLQKLPAIDMRLQQVDGLNNNHLVLDYYNSDYQSLVIALDFIKQQHAKRRTTVILSDILQSNLEPKELYKKVNVLLQNNGIDELIGIGHNIQQQANEFGVASTFFSTTEEFLKTYSFHQLKNQNILLKGARSFQFEKIADRLKIKTHQTSLEVNLSRLQENIDAIKSSIKSSTKLMAMVKALAYGSGGFQIAKLLEFNNIDYLGVAYTDEATQLRSSGISAPIIVLNPDLNSLEPYLEQNIQPVIFSFESLKAIQNEPIKIHLEFDTGMHRLGFSKSDINKVIGLLQQNSNIELCSVFSHLAVADDVNKDDFTKNQIDTFNEICNLIEAGIDKPFIRHLSNTAGIERFPQAQFDMVRLGIGLYGISSLGRQSALQPVSTFKSYITQIRKVNAGEGIGYGQHDISDQIRNIAIIAVGYADGFSRSFSRGKGFFLINGQKAKVVGNVCMDMTMCDVTNISCTVGDEAIIFGDNPRVEELAKSIDTIPYEILTNVSERVNRVFYQE